MRDQGSGSLLRPCTAPHFHWDKVQFPHWGSPGLPLSWQMLFYHLRLISLRPHSERIHAEPLSVPQRHCLLTLPSYTASAGLFIAQFPTPPPGGHRSTFFAHACDSSRPHMSGIIQYLSSCDWLISLNIKSSRFAHAVASVRIAFLFKAE